MNIARKPSGFRAYHFESEGFQKFSNEPVDFLWHVGIGIMPRTRKPVQRQAVVFCPAAVVAFGGTGGVFLPAQQQGRAVNAVFRPGLHCLRQNAVAVDGEIQIPLPVIDGPGLCHQLPAIGRL